MWVLSVDCKELRFFDSPEDIEDGFAALSHVWNNKPEDGPKEQTFQEVEEIQKRCREDITLDPRDLVSSKIRECCKLAESHGYKWVWIDTCCINKTSSAELSEAINSMYRYYSRASVCYAYLRDVLYTSDVKSDGQEDSSFRNSIWFKRGWTLQELIAPRFLLFLSQDWRVLGTKSDLADVVEEEFHIPAAMLRLQVGHAEFSIGQRMSWYGERQTSRPEDEAYCLLGIFDICMPTLYGEGRKAFRRLQEEIMKESPDTTLFAWTGLGLSEESCSCLFAPSPSAFGGTRIAYTPPRHPLKQDDQTRTPGDTALEWQGRRDITFSVTPYGVLVCLPLILCKDGIFGDFHWSMKSADKEMRGLLCLEEDRDDAPRSSRFASYSVCSPRIFWTRSSSGTEEYTINTTTVRPSWQEVLIRPYRPAQANQLPGRLSDPRITFIPAMPTQLTLDAPFRFDEVHIRKFLRAVGADRVDILSNPTLPAGPKCLAIYIVTRKDVDAANTLFIILRIGQCFEEELLEKSSRSAPLWATVSSRRLLTVMGSQIAGAQEETMRISNTLSHDCLKDHLSRWHTSRKPFTLDSEPQTTVTLSFAPCPINPGRTLTLDASSSTITGTITTPPPQPLPMPRVSPAASKTFNVGTAEPLHRTLCEAIDISDVRMLFTDVQDKPEPILLRMIQTLPSNVRDIRQAFEKVHSDLLRFDNAGLGGEDDSIICLARGWQQLYQKFMEELAGSHDNATTTAALMRQFNTSMLEDVDEPDYAALKEELFNFTVMLANREQTAGKTRVMFSTIADDVDVFGRRTIEHTCAHLSERMAATQYHISELHEQIQCAGLRNSDHPIVELLLEQFDFKRERKARRKKTMERRKEVVQLSGHLDIIYRSKALLEGAGPDVTVLSSEISTMERIWRRFKNELHNFIGQLSYAVDPQFRITKLFPKKIANTRILYKRLIVLLEEYSKQSVDREDDDIHSDADVGDMRVEG